MAELERLEKLELFMKLRGDIDCHVNFCTKYKQRSWAGYKRCIHYVPYYGDRPWRHSRPHITKSGKLTSQVRCFVSLENLEAFVMDHPK
jgi:hypothetical protein